MKRKCPTGERGEARVEGDGGSANRRCDKERRDLILIRDTFKIDHKQTAAEPVSNKHSPPFSRFHLYNVGLPTSAGPVVGLLLCAVLTHLCNL